MGKADRMSGFFWLIFSMFVSYHSYKLGLGTLHQPGPGFLFFWTGLVVAILSMTVVLRSFGKLPQGEAKGIIFRRQNVTKVVLVLLSLLLYGLLLERLGFMIVTLFLFIFLLGVVERKRWPFTFMVSLVVMGISYLVFEVWLESQLPKGVLDFLRF